MKLSFIWISAGALGLWLGFPNSVLHLPPLVLLYPVALYVLGVRAHSRTQALRHGWLCGLIGASAALIWLALPIQNVGGLPYALALPCAVCIGAYIGLYGGIFSVCAHTLRNNPAHGLALGLIWYLLEHLRGVFLTGFPWLTLASAFASWPFAVQGASIIGVYGLSGVFVSAVCIWIPAFAGMTKKTHPVIGVLLLTLCAGFGCWRLSDTPTTAPYDSLSHTQALPDKAFPVIMVEGNIDQNQKWDAALQKNTVERYLRLSREALSAHTAQYPDWPAPLLIWPETAMPFYFQSHPLRTHIIDFAREEKLWLLLGAPGIRRASPRPDIFNRAFLVGPTGDSKAWYDKERLVPFGEYLPPLLDFAFLAPLLQGVGAFTPGTITAPLRAAEPLAIGILVCYEAIFPEIARQRVSDGANILVNISNDGWFGDSAAPRQHLELATLRAVEQGRWLVRSTNTGISAIVDAQGRMILEGGQFREQALHGIAYTTETYTLFFTLGPYLPWIAIMVVFLCLCMPPTSIPKTPCST